VSTQSTSHETQLEVLLVKRRIPSFRPLDTSNKGANKGASVSDFSIESGAQTASEITRCLDAFKLATNWGLAPIHSTRSFPCRLQDNIVSVVREESDAWDELPQVTMDRAQGLLRAIESLAARLELAETSLAEREAELASQVLVSQCGVQGKELSVRIAEVLESSSKSIGSVAAALYLLDEDTSELKMRACFGLPKSRLFAPPRDLRSSLADLESLLGNAVLLNDLHAAEEWYSPERFRSALVVPVGTTTMPHGTLWFWSDRARTYQSHEIEVANLAAGRLMSEIEHSLMGTEIREARDVVKRLDQASEVWEQMLPDRQILHENFDLGGWSQQQGTLGGAFHHWNVTADGRLFLGTGTAQGNHTKGGLVATSALSLLRTIGDRGATLKHLMQWLNEQHAGMNEATWQLNLSLVQLNPITGTGSACSAGDQHCLVLSKSGVRHVGSSLPRIGENPDQSFLPGRFVLQPGEMLISFSSRLFQESIVGNPNQQIPREGSPMDMAKLIRFLIDWREEPAQDLANSVAEQLPLLDPSCHEPRDRSFVILKNLR
jgi:serine phosphatase RsbU (regulator of sigma subunit)